MPGNPAIDRFAVFVTLLLQHLAQFGHLRRVDGPLLVAVWNRVRAIQRQVEGLLARIAAGTLRRYPHRRPPPPRPPRSRPAPPAFPSRPLWLIALVQETARTAGLLQDWLAEPQVAAMLEQAPQLRRTLRPLCRMLGVRLPPPPPPPPRAAPLAPPPPSAPPSAPPPAPSPASPRAAARPAQPGPPPPTAPPSPNPTPPNPTPPDSAP